MNDQQIRIGNVIDHSLKELLPKQGIVIGERQRAELAVGLADVFIELIYQQYRYRSGRRLSDKLKDKLLDLVKWLP